MRVPLFGFGFRKPSPLAPVKPRRFLRLEPWQEVLLGIVLLGWLVACAVFAYYYVRFSRLIDARLSGEIFENASLVYAAPASIGVGDAATAEGLAARLRKAGYAESEGSRVGTYRLASDRLEIDPGPSSFFHGELAREGPATLNFSGGQIVSITAREPERPLQTYLLEPEVITTLFDRSRSKRRLLSYEHLPKTLIDAVLAAEDHRFFSHYGVNFYRIIAAAATDIRAEEKLQGGSTLTMQVARNFFLSRRKTLRRKVAEIFLAVLLEQRLSKKEIFELYANQIYLGQRGSFSIYGFGEAANVYFGKDAKSLTLSESALLAALIRGPNLYSPYKYPDRALERRNLVLRRMVETGYLSADEAQTAAAAPLGVSRQNVEATEAPFLVDMVKDQLLSQFSERDLVSQSYRIYTTLDLDLQRAASEAVRVGMTEVDQEIKKLKRSKAALPELNQPQVALVALDPHSGALKALVGGRDYGASQLNHALARRQPGSSFKPFVYAAALNSGVDGSQPLVTTATTLMDEPTTFLYGNEVYEPENYKHQFLGEVTVRDALAHSLNVATVRLAEMVGYDKVRRLAVAAGVNKGIQPTPAIALGAYVATPLEITGAYTIFANGGEYVTPRFILGVNNVWGRSLARRPENTVQVLDPKVAYVMVNLMESVINSGTGVGVRSRGFALPAAGKTGTSHDGWFAGFTSDLLAVVWVGYDDDRELGLSGASSALPVWTEFMKRAVRLPAYQNAQPFPVPPGIVNAPVEVRTIASGTSDPVATREEVFIEGTEPKAQEPARPLGILGRIFGQRNEPTATPPAAPPPAAAGQTTPPPTTSDSPVSVEQATPDSQVEQKRDGAVKRFLSIFKGGNKKAPEQKDSTAHKPKQ